MKRAFPGDPSAVAAEFSRLAKDYGTTKLVGDQYAGAWVSSAFEAVGMAYQPSPLAKSALYLEGLPLHARAGIDP
jgi:hypothetical protein